MVSLAYTFSKLIDDVDPNARCAATAGIQNVYNLKAERGIGCYDVPHRFVEYFVYSVPLGRGGKWLNSTPVVKDLVSGWQISGVTEFQTGQVMTISQTNNTNGFTNVQRSNQVAPASLPRDQRTIGRWFNTSAFVAAPAYTLGNAPRFPLHGPGLNNWDMALMRNFPIHEQWKLQIRGEFYNAMNHPQWSNPNTTIGNNSYGVITSTNMDARTTSLALRIFF
jgi:hypothetical protein